MTDNELDVLLKKKINEVSVEIDLNVDEIISNLDKNKKKEKKQISVFAACVAVALFVIVEYIYIRSNVSEENVVSQKIDLSNELNENYGIIELENEEKLSGLYDGTAAKVYITRSGYWDSSFMLEDKDYEEGIILAKVEDLYYTNWDKDNNENYHYVPTRTIASIKIEKVISESIDLNDLKEIKIKGGILEYEQYMKFWENTNLDFTSDKFTEEYNKLVEEGKEKIYVSSFSKNDTKLEKGKTYLMYVHKKECGDYWVESNNSYLREYDEKTDSVLNNETREYEKLEDVVY